MCFLRRKKLTKPKSEFGEVEDIYTVYNEPKQIVMKRIVKVVRDWQDTNQTLGVCTVMDENGMVIFRSESLERGWRDNKKGESCIPPGEYDLKLEYSNRFDKHLWEIYGVKGRSECKFHAANFWRQLNGCIALGRDRRDLNMDRYDDITDSRNTMNDFHNAMSGFKTAKLIVE